MERDQETMVAGRWLKFGSSPKRAALRERCDRVHCRGAVSSCLCAADSGTPNVPQPAETCSTYSIQFTPAHSTRFNSKRLSRYD
jgi:hypothetical protein